MGPLLRNESIIICPSIRSLEVEVNPKLRPQVGMPVHGHVDPFDRCNLLDILQALEHPTFKAAVRRIVAACNAHGKLARGSAKTEAQFGAEFAGE